MTGMPWPSWARWSEGAGRCYTVGVEEEVMLLNPSDYSLSESGDGVLGRLSDELAAHMRPETHAAVVELATGIHVHVAAAVAELAALRGRLARELREMGIGVALAGMHPMAAAGKTRVSGSERYRMVADSMRSLANREPTLALHVHVGVPDPDDAVRLLNGLRPAACGLRPAVPVLLALSANSPFSRGRDTGFASTRTVIIQGFPRTGTARRFANYSDYVRSIEPMIASGGLPDPSFLWWDVRLQPALGTVEVRVMDAQSTLTDTAGLIALVQSLARLVVEGEAIAEDVGPEVLAENRFLAARDGLQARLIDPQKGTLTPVRALIEELLRRCRPHAAALGCSSELDCVQQLADANGALRQRVWAEEAGLTGLMSTLTACFPAGRESLGEPPVAWAGEGRCSLTRERVRGARPFV